MTDPLSVLALGAAVGGLAGKLAEKTWDSAEGWLRDRFMHHDARAREAARLNTAAFLVELANRVKVLEDRLAIDAVAAEVREDHPQFAMVLQLAVMAGAQTNDKHKHLLLADLVAARLGTDSDTTLALASEMACHAVARATRQQLSLMGLCSALEDVRPREPVPLDSQDAWLEAVFAPFVDVDFQEIDALHLVAIGCATYNPATERSLQLLIRMKFKGEYDRPLPDSGSMDLLQIRWDLGLAGIQLTSVGKLIGGYVFDHVIGSNIGAPSWS